MRAQLLIVVLAMAGACRIELAQPEQTKNCKVLDIGVCNDAKTHSDFHFVWSGVLAKNCTGQSCHETDSTDKNAARLPFDDEDKSYKSLVGTNVPDPDHPGMTIFKPALSRVTSEEQHNLAEVRLVAPNDPTSSYLLYMMHVVDLDQFGELIDPPPDDIGLMPRNNAPLCCQKLDAVKRWVVAGAQQD